MTTYNINLSLLKNFYFKQINEIKDKGFKIIYFKTKVLINLIFSFLLSSVILLFIRLISPLILIKLSGVDMGRIGEYQPLWFLRLKKIGEIESKKVIYIFFMNNSTNHTNAQWLKMYKRKIIILPLPVLKYVLILNQFFTGHKKYEIPNFNALINPSNAKKNQSYVQNLKTKTLNKITENNESVINFHNSEEEIGRSYLRKIDVKEYKFICFHSRDKYFLEKYNPNMNNWSYHDYRNSSIFNYLPAMEELTKKGYFCFRMGTIVKDKLKNTNQKIIDYANSKDQSDFLDIFLGSKCRFFLCSQTGLAIVPETFNRPIIYVNCAILGFNNTFANNSLFISKKYFSLNKNRLLTFKELIDLDIESNSTTQRFKDLNIKLIDNTPDEITDAVMEMENRLNGTWKTDLEDEELQEKFWNIFKYTFIKSSSFRFGSKFLKQNKELLN